MSKAAAAPLVFASTQLAPGEFARRRNEARRRGSPAWLWPEVPVERWTRAMRHISKAAADIFAGRPARLPGGDLMALSLAGYTSGVGPLLGWWFENGLLTAPAESGQLLQLHLKHARERATYTDAQSGRIVACLSDGGASPIVLKGGYTAHRYFPEPATRPASDLDLLVRPDRQKEAEAALAQAGLECVSRGRRESTWTPAGSAREPRSLWLVRADDPWSVDLHHSLDLSAGPGAPALRLDAAEPFDEGAGALRRPLLLLHLAVHASGGLHSLTLLRMIEIILVVRRDFGDDPAAWEEFTATAIRANGFGISFPALLMCERLAPGTIPRPVLGASAKLAPRRAKAIVEDLHPATAQRVDRDSVAEHFMWVSGLRALLRQLRSDIAPHRGSAQSIWSIYEARVNRLLHGRVTR
jgi:hypothetical protein